MHLINLSESKSGSHWSVWVQSFLIDLAGCMRALYTVSRPECPHCFYCGKAASARMGGRDLCERHCKATFPSD